MQGKKRGRGGGGRHMRRQEHVQKYSQTFNTIFIEKKQLVQGMQLYLLGKGADETQNLVVQIEPTHLLDMIFNNNHS